MYEQVEPFSQERSDHRASVLSAFIANSSGGKKGGGQFSPAEIHDIYFDFSYQEPKESITDVGQWSRFKAQLSATYKPPK